MTRLLAVSLVLLLVSGTVWAQDSPVVNRLEVHADWLFQPDRGGGPSPPDTLDPWRYYPLAIGNAWEYRNENNETMRIDIPRDTIIADLKYFYWQRRWYNEEGQPAWGSVDDYLRYDTTSTYIVTSGIQEPYFPWIPCRFDAQPDATLECWGMLAGSVDWMTYEGILEFSDTTVVNVAGKRYNTLGMWTYAADFGEVWGWEKDGRPPRALTFARIDGQSFGTELYPYTVSNESELLLESDLTIQALWPNPVRSSISLQLRVPQIGQVHVSVYDLLGREVLAWNGLLATHTETIELHVGTLPPGAYVVRMIALNQISKGVLFTRIE